MGDRLAGEGSSSRSRGEPEYLSRPGWWSRARRLPRFMLPLEQAASLPTKGVAHGYARLPPSVRACFGTLARERPDLEGGLELQFALASLGSDARIVDVSLALTPLG